MVVVFIVSINLTTLERNLVWMVVVFIALINLNLVLKCQNWVNKYSLNMKIPPKILKTRKTWKTRPKNPKNRFEKPKPGFMVTGILFANPV